MNYQLNFDAVWRDFPSLLAGLGLGLELALISIAIGCVIGLMNAFALLSRYRALRIVASIYVTVVRNTPILVLILLIYFALPGLGIRHHPVVVRRRLSDRSVSRRSAEHSQGPA